jgi:hypothetical protein
MPLMSLWIPLGFGTYPELQMTLHCKTISMNTGSGDTSGEGFALNNFFYRLMGLQFGFSNEVWHKAAVMSHVLVKSLTVSALSVANRIRAIWSTAMASGEVLYRGKLSVTLRYPAMEPLAKPVSPKARTTQNKVAGTPSMLP